MTPEPRRRVHLVRRQSKRLALVHGGRLALAFERASETLTLKPREVRWRRDRARQPWFLGTRANSRLVIVDPRALAEALIDAVGE